MATTQVQLRRYQLAEGQMDAFIERWRRLQTLREANGLHLLFAFADRGANEFVWAQSHQGDIDAAEARYNALPERLQLVAGTEAYLQAVHISKVEVVASPGEVSPTTGTT